MQMSSETTSNHHHHHHHQQQQQQQHPQRVHADVLLRADHTLDDTYIR
jgi:hypothetical protein